MLQRPALVALLALLWLAGCGGKESDAAGEYAYVSAPQVTLRDRVAAVFNKVGTVNNGDKVRVLERSSNKRFLRVRTPDGKEGWMEQRYAVGQDVYDAFQKLGQQYAGMPSQARAITRRIVNMHVDPLRDSAKLYQLKEGEKVELLERASASRDGKIILRKDKAKGTRTAGAMEEDEDLPKPNAAASRVEDWWLVRDSGKHIGWILGRMLDVDIPLEIAQYAEGQRIVTSFVLNEVPEGTDANKKVSQYVVLFSEPKDGLPFDFNQLRVFTWNARKSRYETAYRDRFQGVLPFKVSTEDFGKDGILPVFVAKNLNPDGSVADRKYRLMGSIVRRVQDPAAPVAPAKR